MQFELNAGQTEEQVKFLSRGPGYTLFLTSTQAVFSLRATGASDQSTETFSTRDASRRQRDQQRSRKPKATIAHLRMSLLGANANPQTEGIEQLPGTVNYFIGDNPSHWHADIPTFAKVKYLGVYPGVDLVYYGTQRRLEYDFIVGPGGDPQTIGLGFDGADRLELDRQGGLVVHLGSSVVRWDKPYAYQEGQGVRQEVSGRFVLKGPREVGFQVAAYDRSQPLIIDPVLVYSTYLGGSAGDSSDGIAVDAGGNVFVAGDTLSTDFPTKNAYTSTAKGGSDVFVAKLNATGTALLYSTYLGGNDDEYPYGIAVDTGGNAYVTGYTASTNFPLVNAYQTTHYIVDNPSDVFLTRIGTNGNTVGYSTILGGSSYDAGYAISVVNSSNVWVVGETDSLISNGSTHPTQFPIAGSPFQNSPGGGNTDAFVAKFNTSASGVGSLVYCTFLGGSSDEAAYGVAADASGNVYVTGDVYDSVSVPPVLPNSNFPTLNAFQPQFNAGCTNPDIAGSHDGFVAKYTANGVQVFATFLGGFDDDSGTGIAVGKDGKIYVTGTTQSTNFPTLNAAQSALGSARYGFQFPDAFITVFPTNATSLVYSTYLGGLFDENYPAITLDKFGTVYVTGYTSSGDFPVTAGCDQTNYAGGTYDAFVAKINPAVPGPASLIYSSFLGGSDWDQANAIAIDTNGNFYVTGYTYSTDFPTTAGVFSSTNNNVSSDAFVAKFSSPRDLSVAMSLSSDPVFAGSNLTYTIQINNNGWVSCNNVTNFLQLPPYARIISVSTGTGLYTTNAGVLACLLGVLTNNQSVTEIVTVTNSAPGPTTNIVTLTSNETQAGLEPNTNNNTATIISAVRGMNDVRLTVTAAPNPVAATSNLSYTIGITNKSGDPATACVLTDALPTTLNFVSAVASQGTWFTNGGVLTWTNIAPLTSGAGAAIIITASPSAAGFATNVANVTAFELDLNQANNSATTITTNIALADLSLGGSASGNPVLVGANLTYTFAVTNQGPLSATSVVLTDPLPAGTAFVTATTTQGSTNYSGGVFTCNLGTLASNATATVTLTISPAIIGNITNTATITSAAADFDLSDNSASVVTTVNPAADVSVSQSASPTSFYVTSNVTFTITVTNRGPSTATNVVVTDQLPSVLAFVSAQAVNANYSQVNGLITLNAGIMTNGANASATVVAKATLYGVFTNTAILTDAGPTDPNPANNIASAIVTVNDNPATPFLRITQAGTNVVLSWSTNAVGMNLQSRLSLATNSAWASVTNIPVVVGNLFMVTNAPTGGSKFYRLSSTSAGMPLLNISLTASNVLLSWPDKFVGFGLQSTTNLSDSGVWTLVTNEATDVGGNLSVSDPDTYEYSKFYRLINTNN